MSQLFYGSICITDLLEQLKAKHSAFSKARNGKIYANVNVWFNDVEDKFGNIMSIQINPSKEKKDIDKKMYIGNLKEAETSKPISDRDVQGIDTDINYSSDPSTKWGKEPTDDLPF